MSLPPGRLALEGVSFAAGGRALVQDASLEVAPGEMVGLLGSNGAGKSTLLRTIYRINRPIAGRVLVDGEDAWSQSAAWVAQRVGAVLQDMPADFPLTVEEVVAMGRSAHKRLLEPDSTHDHALIDAAIALLELESFRARPFRTLSGGERQRVLLARAMVQQPRILVLDEPTNHLDIRYQLSLLRFVREIGVTIIAALHDLNLAAMFCDRLCVLDGGRVVATGRPDDVLTAERVSEVWGAEMIVQRHPTSGKVWLLPA
ncbi:ABC transporter ATP-binding protein [Pseudoroseicyclus tamaricis]|uniref:ABC transporter ATP-binding protein n=1 Tax=Pseudoroseicyclus tamaricis TaxID=2705421 RepID=A0A6B2JSV0_9RHOB|nr:ABC transporter ATP-binding protein [Pseudoroseicyclus tamaricis]NDV01105.1 ABC transporter ATP-binding protein [Pseudoroseicyclus tamaricis]